MMLLQIVRMLFLAVCIIWLPAIVLAAGTPVAVFPLQELGEGRSDANLPFTRLLAEHLKERGNEIIDIDIVINFMANNRIRTVGYLETFFIYQARSDLGAPFVLTGSVSQRKENPEPSLGLTLNLIRTRDSRTVWTFVGSLSKGEELRILGIGEPETAADLQPLLLDEILGQWPWQTINEEQQIGGINIDSVVLEPKHVSPGDEVHCRVRLRERWYGKQTPRVFFKVGDQLYPAIVSADGSTYEGTWVAGEENGSFPVLLLLEWPDYGRIETTLLGNILIDSALPLLEIKLRGTRLVEGMPVFSKRLIIMPHLLVRKPLSHWRLAFYEENGLKVGDLDGTGNLPETFIWTGSASPEYGGQAFDGVYEITLTAWDLAGNSASATKLVEMNRSLPQVDLKLDTSEEGVIVNLELEGKVPLAFWRLEMWDKEGRILTEAEGKELPVKIKIETPDTVEDQEIEGFLMYQDVMGKRVRQPIQDLLPKLKKQVEEKAEAEKKKKGISKSWVEEF